MILEDDPQDSLAKAMRGLALTPESLSQRSHLSLADIELALAGQAPLELIKSVAAALQLNTTAFDRLAHPYPVPELPDAVKCFTSEFGHQGVNAFLIQLADKAILVDTGTSASEIAKFMRDHKLELQNIFITHQHHDHIGGLKDLPHVNIQFPEHLNVGETIPLDDDHSLEILDVTGHETSGQLVIARAYRLLGFEKDICIVGDSLFAGSMGGTRKNEFYQMAVKSLNDMLETLPAETILCPGHGPLTTVFAERERNPFYRAKAVLF
ncbi:MBL fold metallo-hydrolase [Persicirhabdus sediminis]|uniref:MBL fold metallo-hydrolase n=1 Tax=Persicirhabdus sediminis TaxID=454144 RepID=A0A8J7SIZ7_9BACT|nr:MBL fold metallo-hydrolase [Persicirhabdus sediminis]MBK1789880.1 MBL fold metallo-hydrolase [Persicirhabdus sediminis]